MKLKIYGMAIVFVLLLVGCNYDGNDGTRDNGNNNIEPTRFNDNNINNRNNRDQGTGMRPNGTTNINNRNTDNRDQTNQGDRYEVSEEAADKITNEIEEIHHAYVLTTNNNAYVAAVLDNDDRHDNRMNNRKNTSDKNRNTNETRNISDGNLDRNRDDGNLDRNRDEGAELTDEVKEKIADIVQSIDNDIDNVYVTTNPDFADLTNDYMNDFNDGKPVRGFFDQIGNMIERVFPQNKR